MRRWFNSFWENYKYRFVPWIILNLRKKKSSKFLQQFPKTDQSEPEGHKLTEQDRTTVNISSSGPIIVHHVNSAEDKVLLDDQLVKHLVTMFSKLLEYEVEVQGRQSQVAVDEPFEKFNRGKEIMHSVFGYSVERRKSQVAEHAGTGVFLASGTAKPGSLIALYPGSVYLPSEPLFFPSLGNPFIFRCSDNIHIDGNDKWISKSIYKSCAARDKFHIDLPCCDESWLTPTPVSPLNVGQYVNNRSKTQENNVVYQEVELPFGIDTHTSTTPTCFPIHLCRYLPNVWSNPNNNLHALRVIPLVAVREINEGDEILSSYFTVVHADKKG